MLPFLIQYVNLQAKPPSEERSLSVNLIMLLLSLKHFRGSTLPTGWSPNSQQHREGPSGCGLYWPPTPPALFLTTPLPLHLTHALAVLSMRCSVSLAFFTVTIYSALDSHPYQPHTDSLLLFKMQFRSAPQLILCSPTRPQAYWQPLKVPSADIYHYLCGFLLYSLTLHPACLYLA